MHEYDLHADVPEEDDILHDLHLQRLIDHRVAAVFDDDDLAVVFLDIRERLREDLRPLRV